MQEGFIQSKLIKLVILLMIIGLGYIFGYYHASSKQTPAPVEIHENSGGYTYINPLVFTKISKDFYTQEFSNFNDQLKDNLDKIARTNKAESVSVYYRDLNTGHWTGINEDKRYHPSSMLKVLGLMSYLRKSEDEPNLLSKRYYYEPENDPGQHYAPSQTLTAGLYSVDDLLKQMIVYSDNDVLKTLDKNDKDNIFNQAYHTFQLPLATNIDDIDGYMSPRSYSALFRTLYNSTYLSRENSEKALKLLTQTDFKTGLVATLPKDIVVAHKFGEHTYELTDGTIENRELHDCGVVYYPAHPYLICVMTSGSDFSVLEKIISSISRSVYDYVDNHAHVDNKTS